MLTQAIQKYCEHFEHLRPCESPPSSTTCKYCALTSQDLWGCLSRNCGAVVCGRNNKQHLLAHLQESKRNKKFHGLFIDLSTAQIVCIQCNIEIYDIEGDQNCKYKGKLDPYPIRLKVLPILSELSTQRMIGQLENSQGHRRISSGLVGVFGDRHSHSINAAIQFLAHIPLFRDLLIQLPMKGEGSHWKIHREVREIVVNIKSAQFRAVRGEKIAKLMYTINPKLQGYSRKDPFPHFLAFLSQLNDCLLFTTLNQAHQSQYLDEWDAFYKKGYTQVHNPVYESIESTLGLNYVCTKCKKQQTIPHQIQFLKLSIPKKKRKARQIEKQFAEHRIPSPTKTRRKSLINFIFQQQQIPLTIPQLIIDLLKQPLHRDKSCDDCQIPLRKNKLSFLKLPSILIIQIARISKSGQLDSTPIPLSFQAIDMGPFSVTPTTSIIYEFQSAICIDRGHIFPVVCIGEHNKQIYMIRDEIVEMVGNRQLDAYVVCYKRKQDEKSKQKWKEIKEWIYQDSKQQEILLPDGWATMLKHGIERSLVNPLICKHGFLKPTLSPRQDPPSYLSVDHYQFLSSNVFVSDSCNACKQEVDQLALRRKLQRQAVLQYDRIKGQGVAFCMISNTWITKWSNFLYNKERLNYLSKGYPMPGSIDNKALLDGNKCKANLIKNQDFKVINIFLWKLLKELYGGGPEIRYKWKSNNEIMDEQLISEIKYKAASLKQIYLQSLPSPQSPKKLGNSSSYIQRSTLMEEPSQSEWKMQAFQDIELEQP